MTPHFHPLRVSEVRRETAECVSLALEVPAALRDAFHFTQGQYLNLRAMLGGEEVRRSYSICSGTDDGELRVAVKAVPGGTFSTYANRELQPGATLEAMPPEGRFFTPLDSFHRKHYVAFAAGSGITPVLSLIKTTLAREPQSRFSLVYGNRNIDAVIFSEQLEDLKDQYLARLALFRVFSRDPQPVELFNGRVDAAKVRELLGTLLPPAAIDEAFVCGPDTMPDEVAGALEACGVARHHIHLERFGAPAPRASVAPAPRSPAVAGASEVTVIVDGKQLRLELPEAGPSVLDAALRAGADLPYACKAGVCCTCRAMLVEGEVRMDANYTLSDEELQQGFRLTCQSHPVTPRVVLDYDRR